MLLTLPAAARRAHRSVAALYSWVGRRLLKTAPLRLGGGKVVAGVDAAQVSRIAASMRRGRPPEGRKCWCGRPHVAGGFCRKHYDADRKARRRITKIGGLMSNGRRAAI